MWLQLVSLLWSAFFFYLFEICGQKRFVFSDSVADFQHTLEFDDLSVGIYIYIYIYIYIFMCVYIYIYVCGIKHLF